MSLTATHRLTLSDGSTLDIAPVDGGFAVVDGSIEENGTLKRSIKAHGFTLKRRVLQRASILAEHLSKDDPGFDLAMGDLLTTPEMDAIIEELAVDRAATLLKIVPTSSHKYAPIENSPFRLALGVDGEPIVFDGMVERWSSCRDTWLRDDVEPERAPSSRSPFNFRNLF